MAEHPLKGSARLALRLGWWILVMTFVMSFVVNLLRLAGPMFMILIYDRVLPARSEETLVALFAMLVAFLIVQGILDYSRRRVLARFGAQFQERLEASLFAATSQNAMFDPGRSKPTAGLDELDGLRAFFHSNSLIALFDFAWTPMFVLVVFVLHPTLGWVCLGGMAIMLILALIQMTFMGAREEEAIRASKGIGELKNMIVASRDVVRGQEMTGGFKTRWLEARRQSRDKAIALKDWTVWFDSLSSVCVMLVRYSVLAVGAYLTLAGTLTIGALVAATFLVTRVLTPVDRFMTELPNIVEAFRHWGKLNKILSVHASQGDEPIAEQTGTPRTRLQLVDVSVRSPINGATILRGVSLDLAPKAMVQINGGSGRGKTVLAETMLGIWRRSSGTILVDGVNIERLSDADTARIFGYMPETPGFVAATIAENIAHLDTDPDPQKVAAAARKACLHAIITALPDGYQTRIDANASVMSRGQRHQLALARAIYHGPAILIIDEPDPMLLDALPKTMDGTFDHILGRGGSIVVFARKPLAVKQISASYKLEGGKLKPVSPTQVDTASKPRTVAKLTVLVDPGSAPDKDTPKTVAGTRG